MGPIRPAFGARPGAGVGWGPDRWSQLGSVATGQTTDLVRGVALYEAGESDDEADSDTPNPVEIDLDGFERRAIQLPVDRGFFLGLSVNDKGQLIYGRVPASELMGEEAIQLLDLEDDEEHEKTVLDGVSRFVLSADGSEVLLILHSKLGDWMQPGGHVEPHDAGMAAAARREVVEETSLASFALADDALFDVDVHPVPAGREPGHLHFDLRFLFRAASTDLSAGAEVVDARWVPLGEIGEAFGEAELHRPVMKLTS